MSIKMFLFVVTKILILFLLLFGLFLLQSLREVAVLMSYLNHTPPLGKGLKVEGRVGGAG
jgi:hypothetical protein